MSKQFVFTLFSLILIAMISVDDFLKVNRFSDLGKAFKQKLRAREQGTVKADLLRGRVICGTCNHFMVPNIPAKRWRGKITNYFYYRCDNKDCSVYGKSTRAKVIMDFVQDFLQKHQFTSKEVYNHYVEEMKRIIKEKERELESKKRSLQQVIRALETKIEDTKDLIREERKDEYIKNVFKKELKGLDAKLKEAQNNLQQANQGIQLNQMTIMSYSEFLELFRDLPVLLAQTRTLREKDFIIGKIFLNFTVNQKKVLSYQLNPPFDGFIKSEDVPLGRGPGN